MANIFIVFEILLCICFQILNTSCQTMQPSGILDNETTTCEEFSRHARFNPYSVLNEEWMLFYYWGPVQAPMFIKMRVPTAREIAYLKYILDGHVVLPVNWTARSLLMTERNNSTYFLVEQGDRGQYLVYEPFKGMKEGDFVHPVHVRMKQTGDNRMFGIMVCQDRIAYAFSRTKEVPKKRDLQEAAARLGFQSRGGKSYLYQGHHWMPIPEADDSDFHAALHNPTYKKHRHQKNFL